MEFLSQGQYGDQPFFMFVGYTAPHFPLIVPEAYWERYRGKVVMPEIPLGFLEQMPLNYKVCSAQAFRRSAYQTIRCGAGASFTTD